MAARAEADAPRKRRPADKPSHVTPEWKDTDPPFMRALWEKEAPPPLSSQPEFIDRMERAEARWHKRREGAAKRRAAVLGSEISQVSRARVIERDASTCYLCGKVCDRSELHLDHIVPLSRGGSHSEDNLAVACSRCNMSKGARLTDKRPAALQ